MSILSRVGVPTSAFALMDATYVYVDDKSADSFFYDLATQVMDTLKSWESEYRDCDKFSRVVQALGQLAHATQWGSKKNTGAGLSLGVFNYMRDKDGGHSINCIVTKVKDKEEFYIRFFEPQTGREVHLTKKEINSAFLVLL